MKIELNIQKLKNAVLAVEKVAGKHITLPVLSCILIEVKNNTAILKATNLDVGIEASVPVKSNENGTIAIPAHTLSAFISQIVENDQVVKLDNSSGNLQITTTKTTGLIKTQPFEDFPSIPRVVDGKEFILSPEIFLKGLKSVWYSSSVSSVKPELSSVFVYKNEANLVFVATDSFRLAEKKVKLPTTTDISDILIPFKNIPDLSRILENMKEDIKITINKNLISFESGEVYVVSRLIDGIFPDYRQIIPKNYSTEVIILKQDLINALKVSNVFADKFSQVRFVVDPKAKIFNIQTKNSDIGENVTSLDASLSGDALEINFNYKYIVDCFQSIDSDSVSLSLGGISKPMVIRPISGDQSFMYLVMPMNR